MKYFLSIFGAILFLFIIIFLLDSETTTSKNKDFFNWKIIKRYPNNINKVEAIVKYGTVNNGANTSPFYSVVLQTISENKHYIRTSEVWNSQHKTAPTIKWINNTYIEIVQINDHIWEYTPGVTLNNKDYQIRLKILP